MLNDPLVRRNLSKRWYNMMSRCNNPDHANYKTYGGVGIRVSLRWQDKETFIKDAIALPGYNRELLFTGQLWLDKDLIVPGNKVYDVAFCCFLLKTESNQHKPQQMKPFVAIAPDGQVYKGNNQSEFAKTHGLSQTTISECLAGKHLAHKGWVFRVE